MMSKLSSKGSENYSRNMKVSQELIYSKEFDTYSELEKILTENLASLKLIIHFDESAHLESTALKQARTDSNKDDCAPDYFAFGETSPKQNNRDELDSAAHSRDVDDWLLTDKWGKSHYPSVPDSEAATAIESILNEELS